MSRITVGQVKRNVVYSVAAQVVYMLVSLLLNLIVPKYIDEYQFAYWQAYWLYVSYVGILHWGLLDGIVLRYSQYNYDELDKKRIRSQFLVLLTSTSLMMLVTMGLTGAISPSALKNVLPYVAVGMVVRNVFKYTSFSFQITNRIRQYASLTILSRVLLGVFFLGLIVGGVNDYRWYCVADLLAEGLAVVIMSFQNKGLYFGSILSFKETLKETWTNVSCGISLLFANWLAFLLTGLARILVERHWDLLTFGKLSFAFSIVSLFLTFVSAISVVVLPSLKRIDSDKLPQLYSNIRGVISPLFIIILLLYYPGCIIIEWWLPKYASSLNVVGILLPMIVYSSKVSLLTNNYLKAMRKERSILYINIISLTFAAIFYSLSVFALENINYLLISIVMVVIIRSVLSENVVCKVIDVKLGESHIVEILTTTAFIFFASFENRLVGFLCYGCVVILYSIKYARPLLKIVKK